MATELLKGAAIGFGLSLFALSLSIVGATVLCAANTSCSF